MAYTKLDAGLTDSTIWQAPDTTRIVWITLLAMADQNGYIGASMPGLAGRARVSLDACIEAVDTLMSPDPWSRTRDHDGRRIAEADGGWILLNHAKYRAMQSADDRRERSRIAMAALRERRKLEAMNANGCPVLTKLPQAEAEAEANKKTTRASRTPTSISGLESVSEQVIADWKALRKDKRAAVTTTAVRGIQREADKAGISLEAAMEMSCQRGWTGFKADWIKAETKAVDVFGGAK
jgi:hypothetical protein